MKILASVGARTTALTAVAALTLAAPAAADATAYLMYLKGSEGPPAVPMRVVWDARDDAYGRVTIDLGANYEPALTKLGLPRVLEYDATRDKSQFAVREGEFARFVKVVAASIVQVTSMPRVAPPTWTNRRRRPVGSLHVRLRQATGKASPRTGTSARWATNAQIVVPSAARPTARERT